MRPALFCALAAFAAAAHAETPAPFAPVIVTGTVHEQALHDAPFAISSIAAATLRESGPMVNLSG